MGVKVSCGFELRKMLPATSLSNVVDRGSLYPITCDEFGLWGRAGADRHNNVVGESRGWVLLASGDRTQSMRPCVTHVVSVRHPFKIVRMLVRLITVFVVDLVLRCRRRANEGAGNESVRTEGLSDFPQREADAPVSARTMLLAYGRRNVAPETANLTEIADFVQPFVADNGTPFFGSVGTHREAPFSVSCGRVFKHRARIIVPQEGGAPWE